MTFRLTGTQLLPAWRTCTIETKFDPRTGNIRPWEMYGCFTYPHKFRKHWGSFKTEAALLKAVAKQTVKTAELIARLEAKAADAA